MQTAEQSKPQNLDQIVEAVGNRETDGIAEFREFLEQDPENWGALGHLAWALAVRGEHEESIEMYERMAALDEGDAEVRWRKADRLINLGRIDEAEAVYRQVVEDHPECFDAQMGVRYVAHLRRFQSKGKQEPYIPDQGELTPLQKKNQKRNAWEYDKKKIELKSLPPQLYLESTTKCNFFCKTCSKGYGSYYAEDLQNEIFEKVKKDVMPTNSRISITGFGEPTLASDFDEILGMSLDNGSHVHFVTNASLLNFERLEKLTKCPVTITISFDGGTKETFEEVRAGSNFDRTLEKLAMIKKLRDIHLSQSYSGWNFNFVALRKNIHELSEVVRIAHRYNISDVGVADYAFNDVEFDDQSLRFDPVHANKCISEAKAVAAELGVTLKTPPKYDESAAHVTRSEKKRSSLRDRIKEAGGILPQKDRFPRRCSSPWSEPYINTNGNVVPCCTSGQYLGNMQKDSFKKIWNGWRYKMLRWRIETVMPPSQCRDCFVIWGINGGNAGNVKAKEGILIKGAYVLERRAKDLAKKVLGKLRETKRKLKNQPAPVAPEPNYSMGKPIRKPK